MPASHPRAGREIATDTPDWQDAAPARQSANYATHQVQINAERSTSTGIRLSDTTRIRTWLKARQVADGLNSTPDRSISARVIFAISSVADGNQCATFVADVRACVSNKFLGLALCGNHV